MPVSLKGSTSGSVTLQAPAVAGVNTITLPANSGTVVTTASSNALPITAISATGTPSASTYLNGAGAWAAVSASGQLIRAPQILTSGTSYTTPAGCNAIYVECVGAGGGGSATGDAQNYPSGGAGGAYVAKYFSVSPSTAYSYVIGTGGASATSSNTNVNSGGIGGNTTFTGFVSGSPVTITAGGGNGGGTNNANSATARVFTRSGGTASNGDININGQYALLSTGGVSASVYTKIAGSVFAPQVEILGSAYVATAPAAQGYGAGGYPAQNSNALATSSAGGGGMIRIWEYT